MSPIARIHRDQRGLVGKFIVGWLFLVVVFGLAAIDGASIMLTTFRLSDIATTAAADAWVNFRDTDDVRSACGEARNTVAEQDPGAKVVTCEIDRHGRVVTITIRKTAATLVVDRLDFLKDYAKVERTETISRRV
jgi:hypothetical protein